MNREDEFELRLAEWLEEGPYAAPDRAVEAAIAHARTHPRRRLLPAVFRRNAMSESHLAPVAPRHILHAGRAFAAGVASIALVAVLAVSGLALLVTRQSNSGGSGGHIYWATHGGSIGRANSDGSGVNPSFITAGTSACGVAVFGGHIYWANDETNTIGRANLDGTGVNPKFITNTVGACTIASDGKYLYWPTRNGGADGSIVQANLDGTVVDQAFVPEAGIAGSSVGLAIDGSYMYWASNWAYILRADFNLPIAGQFISLNGPPSGIAISGGYIYWGHSGGTTIGRAKLDYGQGKNESFIRLDGNPGGLAADGTYLYWSDSADGTIGRAKLDGTGVNESFISGLSRPAAVAIGD